MKMKYIKVKDIDFLIRGSKKLTIQNKKSKMEFAEEIPFELLLKNELNKKNKK